MSAQVTEGDKRLVHFYTGVDLTTATSKVVRAILADDLDAVAFTLTNDVVTAVDGHLTHKTDGTLAVGLYYTWVEVEWPDGTRLTIPTPDAPLETLEITPAAG